MGGFIPAREAKVCPIGSYHYTCSGFEGCCEVNPCETTRCPDEYNPYLTATELQAQKTIASVAAPVLVSPTSSSSKASSATTDKKAQASTSSDNPTTTFSSPEPTATRGIWLTDDRGSPASTIASDDSTGTPFYVSPHTYTPTAPVETQAIDASAPALAVKSDQHDLPVAAQAGIAVSALVVICMVIAAYFLCTKQRKKLRASRESISSIGKDGRKHSSEDETSQPAMTTNPFCPEEVFSPYGRRYEEPQTRFNRVNDMSASRMMNHPVSPDTRDSMSIRMAPPPIPSPAMSPGTFRATTASPDFLSRTATTTPDVGYRTANSTPDFTSRMTTPDYMSRLGTATPELHGPPQQAAIAELASPGLPKVVEIHSSRSGLQKYKPYRPDGGSLYPVAETTPSYLNGTLNATEHERSEGRYVTSWSKWDPAA
ncbi:hypothetical protein CPAR01_05057 [Colletotrichum paranaense]|uniref:Uncharacterized protein n=1 Tax=Colletotrichum paranaense TaxID=1914294 RepID=A0ABQ9SQR5_9PEZI|nr:uncharacterized protein CPAR01_05057 [Colletotrichum paranaense]KAK1541670.1 hypothetical protein CPAR01_05057 [Colletotrichum paranaense]